MSAVDMHSDIRNTCIKITDITNSEKKDCTIEIYVKNDISKMTYQKLQQICK